MTPSEPDRDVDPRKYIRVADELREQIKDGRLAPGEPTPGREVLARQTGWSRLTCAKALRLLESEGLLVRYPGLGYFVRKQE